MTDLVSDAAYCHRCGAAVGAPPDRGEQLRQLELRLMEAETQKAELEVRWAREREEQRSESAGKAKAARALGYNLVGVAVLLLMLGYLFACALWLRQTRLEGAGAWILAVLIVGFVMAIALLVASEIIESAAKREQEREHGRELNLEDVKLDGGGGTPS